MHFQLQWLPEAEDDLGWWVENNPKKVDRIEELVLSIENNPFVGIGKPEPLKKETDVWSRRITKKDRLVYQVTKGTIYIVSCKGHYGDK